MELGRIILVDPDKEAGDVSARRLEMQGYQVFRTVDPSAGAYEALCAPPKAVIADLWMPGISGVQLCRLLRAEPSTTDVPIVLRGPEDDRRTRFWAERAGASAYVGKGRMGELVRALSRAIAACGDDDAFFTDLQSAGVDIRDRIAAHLDKALFESVIAAEIRALGRAASFERLFDLLSQFVAEVTSYRWLSLSACEKGHLGVHVHPASRSVAIAEARATLAMETAHLLVVEDEDASANESGPGPVVVPIRLGESQIGRLTVAFCRDEQLDRDQGLLDVVARELASPLQLALLMEESRRMAKVDALTGLYNRRAFTDELNRLLTRCHGADEPVCVALIDVDHFKSINDQLGHFAGDQALREVAALLRSHQSDDVVVGRWGGEEFVVVIGRASLDEAAQRLNNIRQTLAATSLDLGNGQTRRVTFSSGVAQFMRSEPSESTLDRADRGMYLGKTEGRNRVVAVAEDGTTVSVLADEVPVAANG